MTDATSQILIQRGERYGNFADHAEITHMVKDICKGLDPAPMTERVGKRIASRWDMMERDQREALEMIAHKLGRILNGDPHYADSWADIAGYARLVADRLEAGEAEARR